MTKSERMNSDIPSPLTKKTVPFQSTERCLVPYYHLGCSNTLCAETKKKQKHTNQQPFAKNEDAITPTSKNR